MPIWPRLKSMVGGDGTITPKTVAAATTLRVPDDLAVVRLTGTATVTSLTAAPQTRGRLVWFVQSDSGTTTLTNSPGTTTVGQMDLGGLDPANTELGPSDWILLYLKSDGTWVRVMAATNN